MRRPLAALALVAALALPAAPAVALTVDEIARDVRCPTCDTTLNTSDSPAARQMKAYIAERIERGWTRDQIIDGLVAEFGEDILATPGTSGFDLLAWAVPGAVVGGGLLTVVLLTRSWTGRRPGGSAVVVSPQEAEAIERELRRLPD